MTKFIEALKAQTDPRMQRKAKPMKCLNSPVTLTPELCREDVQNRYLLRLNWNIAVWIGSPCASWQIEKARHEAMKELNRVVYGEIMGDLCELRYLIRYGDQDKAEEQIDKLLEKIK